MLEDIIGMLQAQDIQFEEGYDDGRDAPMVSFDTTSLDKIALLDIIIAANDAGMEFDLTTTTMTIYGANMEGAEPDFVGEPDYNQMALDQMDPTGGAGGMPGPMGV